MATDAWLEECNDYRSMFSGISLSPQQTLEVFLEDEKLLFHSLIYSFETGERERFQSLVAKKLIGAHWPCGAEAHEIRFKNFGEKIAEAALRAGYEIEVRTK